ncbi:MAG: magnesium/cobalt efflux protein [Sneathiella sp.]|jgi:CBS domain containing-hemolysin-like protein|uniref:hemolysin family protein n=1 Tax=Sneathiella sp. TaxID=1964365 RepID=UPI000C62AD26|nr:hemolysin family protein [Sneathiella sp.]MAL79078.1 magnesium/cobalt efflux protein [Sneathiella sp.]
MTDNVSSTSLSENPDSPTTQKQSNAVLHMLKRVLGIGQQTERSVRSTLEELIEEHDDPEQSINPSEKLMLTNILSFSELSISDVMVPRADIEAIDASLTLEQVAERFKATNHSRMPVYEETLDNVTGMFHIKDLINFWGKKNPGRWQNFRREILFVPPSMSVPDLLLKMRATHIHMAAVVDEYGGIDGLVTIEDLVEEIVGDIEDEHDEQEGPLIIVASNGTIEADARASIEELEALVETDLLPEEEDEDVDTVGGLVFQLAGQIPARGEIISHPDGLDFEIIDADPRKVKRVRIHRRPPETDAAE